jgi:23S rRNA (cytidine1920-2'-O)/16S rRNA (cytidine1409-2'-O)-methyltransferase
MPRLDVALVERGFCQSRHQAKLLIKAGKVKVNSVFESRPSANVTHETCIELSDDPRYVSRGGHKLAHALGHFSINLDDKTCLDIGSSTGGFTDCCLKLGASLVYAVDVGTDQLHKELRTDSRVVLMEKTNIRELQSLPSPIDFICCDVSFCSVNLISPSIKRLSQSGTTGVILIKPQFEVGPRYLRKGRVRSLDASEKAIEKVILNCQSIGIEVLGRCDSPIIGAKKGNLETLVHFRVSE